jgi:hypothetical protein
MGGNLQRQNEVLVPFFIVTKTQTQKLYQPPHQNEVLVPFFIVTKTTLHKLYQPPRQNEVLIPFFIVTKMTTQKDLIKNRFYMRRPFIKNRFYMKTISCKIDSMTASSFNIESCFLKDSILDGANFM